MSRDISSTEVEATSTVPMYLPLRKTVHRSATALISASLWVMNRMLLPSALKPRMISMSSSISWGVSTAVGSSKIRILIVPVEHLQDLHPLLHTYGDVEILASGSIFRLYRWDRARTFSRAFFFCRTPM